MRKLMLAVAVVMACGLFSGPALLQERGGEDETGPYEVVPNWPQQLARPGYALGISQAFCSRTGGSVSVIELGVHNANSMLQVVLKNGAQTKCRLDMLCPERRLCSPTASAPDAPLDRWCMTTESGASSC